MKYALTLLFILALGWFAAQAIKLDPVHSYESTNQDQILLQNIYSKIDTMKTKNPAKLDMIEEKLPAIFSRFDNQSYEYSILHEIYGYIIGNNDPLVTNTQDQNTSWSDEMIVALGEEME